VLLKIGLMAVVDFTAQWCGPCKKIKGPFKDMAKANPNVVFLQVWQRMCLNVSSGCRAERARGEKVREDENVGRAREEGVTGGGWGMGVGGRG
jgi:thiol-disulfide isomerase/thioredoxin